MLGARYATIRDRKIKYRNYRKFLGTTENPNNEKTVKRIRFPGFKRRVILKNNVLSRCVGSLEFHAGAERHQLEIISWHQPYLAVGLPLLKIRVGKELIYITLSRWPKGNSEFGMPSMEIIQTMPKALRIIVAQAGLGDFLPVLEDKLDEKVTIMDLTRATRTIMYEESMQMVLDRGNDLVIVGLFSSNEFMDSVLARLQDWPPPTNVLENQVLFRTNLIIGYSHLTQADLQSLSCGDVVLLEPCDFLDKRWIQMRLPASLEIYLKIEQGKMMVEDIKQDNMVEEMNSEPVNIDELNVELTFDVGGQQIPLNELRKVQKGYTFELDRPLSQLVTIRCNGQKIGNAELIEVEERVGMRVVSIIGK